YQGLREAFRIIGSVTDLPDNGALSAQVGRAYLQRGTTVNIIQVRIVMGDRKEISSAADLNCIAKHHSVQVPQSCCSLPVVRGIVRLRNAEHLVLGGERTRPVPGHVGADYPDAQALDARRSKQSFRIAECGRAPGGVRLESVGLVEQDALRSLEYRRLAFQLVRQVIPARQPDAVGEGSVGTS